MALFPNMEGTYSFKGKTHTGLVISEGNAPAQEFVVAKAEGVKFNYAYGPEGNQNVVIAKGKAVEAAEAEFDPEKSRKVTALKTAAADTTKSIGVNHHNLYERKRDRFSGGNQGNPVVITRSVIELPLFEHEVLGTAQGFADAMQFGAAYAANANKLQPGDYVKVGANGNFVKVDTAVDSPFQVVGQVLQAERELPPAGFLQYYMDMSIPELEAFFKSLSTTPSPGANPDGSAAAYPYGQPYTNKGWLPDFEKMLNPQINKGIPFLTDGYFKAKQTVTNIAINDIYDATTNNDGHVEARTASGQVAFGTVSTGVFSADANGASVQVAADSRNAALFIKLRHPIDKVEASNLAVKYVGGEFTGYDLHIDYVNNTVVVYLEPGVTYENIAIDAPLVVDPVAGVPTEWDHAGAVGAVRILLQK